MIKYKAVIQYIGTRYAGWQIQKNQITVQGLLRESLARVSGETVSVVGSGRTDSGVHALAQVAHFRLSEPVPPDRLQRALNGVLPWDIRVLGLSRAPATFHAQRSAVRKRYEYRIFNGRVLPPFLHDRVLHVVTPLDVDAMRQGAACLPGRHDFKAFTAAASKVRDFERTLSRLELHQRGPHLRIVCEADGFLHHMVRNITGTLLEVGRGRRPPEDVARVLATQDRRQAGPTAPPQGLYLVKVWYRRKIV